MPTKEKTSLRYAFSQYRAIPARSWAHPSDATFGYTRVTFVDQDPTTLERTICSCGIHFLVVCWVTGKLGCTEVEQKGHHEHLTLDAMASEQLDAQFVLFEERLARDYTTVDTFTVHTLVERERSRFAAARIHVFLPVLVERAVRTTLASPPARHRQD